ncbi:extracellular solute-binding protein [Streptomyces sp. NPDC002896]|uniref:extracellular solute-binding protein n=1 Tax=Streptomyces sp. NPDC002896 TaxID=3154438 RepID=UPI00332B9F9C
MSDTSTVSAMSRRSFLNRAAMGAGALTLPGLLSACGSQSAGTAASKATSGPLADLTSTSVVYGDFGGTTREARNKAFFQSFTKETGVKVAATVTVDAVQAKMEKGEKGTFDALPAGQYELYRSLAYDSIEKLPSDVTRNDQLEEKAQPYSWGTFVTANTQAYLNKTFSDGRGPQSWEEFWDVKKFPGKRGWPGTGYAFEGTVEAALLADGVAPEDLYPLDWERGFAKLDELRPHLVFYTEFPQVQQFLISSTVSVAKAPSGLFFALNAKGTPTTVVMNEAFQSPNISITPKGAPHKDTAFALAEWMADAKRQADFAALTGYGPGNEAAFEYMSADLKKQVVNSPANNKISIRADNTAIAKIYDEYVSRYTKWLAKK